MKGILRMKKPFFKNCIWLVALALILAALFGWIVWENDALECTTYTVKNEKLPQAFDGYRIAQISDLHNDEMGKDNEKLLAMLRQAQPDMIAITGDLIDYYHTDVDISLAFVKEAVKIAPCYFVTGNHEARIAQYNDFRKEIESLGVCVLSDATEELEKDGETILVKGVDDPYFISDDEEGVLAEKLQWLVGEDDPYTILLSHRPCSFPLYVESGVDLVLAGHLHGGQFRIPFLGGLFTPSTGFFPEYDAGLYTQGETSMVVSRGIGNSIFPFRINNRPELVLVELQAGN